jgi:rod shape-determining protein MreD
MHQLGFVLFTYAAAVLFVGTGSSELAGVGFQPHYLLLVVITAVLYFQDWTALVWAAVAGLLSDGLSSGPLGVEMASFTMAALVLLHHLRRHAAVGMLRISLLCFLVTFATLTLSNTIRLLVTDRSFDHARLVLLITSTALATAFVVGGFRLVQALGRRIVLRSHRRAASY